MLNDQLSLSLSPAKRHESCGTQGHSLEQFTDDDNYDCIGERRKLESETENMGVSAKKRKGVKAVIIMATPCAKSLGGGRGRHTRQRGYEGRKAC